jgi:hypothetical protein
MVSAVIDLGRTDVRKTFKKWDKQEGKQAMVSLFSKINQWKIAASILILVAAGILLFIFQVGTSSGDLYQTYYQPYPNLIDPIQKGVDNNTQSSVSQLYELGQYEHVVKQEVSDPSSEFYVALSWLATNDLSRAVPLLERFSGQREFRFHHVAQWYLALAYLTEKQIDKSTNLLEQIKATPDHDFRSKASQLLAQLTK